MVGKGYGGDIISCKNQPSRCKIARERGLSKATYIQRTASSLSIFGDHRWDVLHIVAYLCLNSIRSPNEHRSDIQTALNMAQ